MRLIGRRALSCISLLIVLSMGFLARAQEGERPTIRVVDDNGCAVDCVIVLVLQNGSELRLGKTGEGGRFAMEEQCQQGERVRAQPESPEYYWAVTECPVHSGREIKVTKRLYLVNLKNNADVLEKSNQPAKAALVYSEIAWRAVVFDQGRSQEATTKVYTLMGTVLGVEDPVTFDWRRKEYIASKELNAAIEEFQRMQGITVSGNLDYTTLSVAANSDIGPYIFHSLDDLTGTPDRWDR